MECTCVYLSVCLSMCQDGWWWVKVVARSEEYKCIYMLVVNRGGLLSYLKLGARMGGDYENDFDV